MDKVQDGISWGVDGEQAPLKMCVLPESVTPTFYGRIKLGRLMEACALPQMASECNHMCPCKRKAEEVWGQAEENTHGRRQSWDWCRHNARAPTVAARVGKDASSPEPPGEIWPGWLTTWFQTSDPQNRKRYVSAVWGHVDVIVCYGFLGTQYNIMRKVTHLA